MNSNIFRGFQIMALFAVLLLAVSCSDQDGVNPTDKVSYDDDPAMFFAEQTIVDFEEKAGLGRRGCFEIVFPITIDFPDGSSAEVASYEEFVETLKTWKEENPDVDGRPSIALPFDVIARNGEVISIESDEMLKRFKRACMKPDRPGKRDCFTIVYPVTLVFPDGTTADVTDADELKSAITEWKENHPDSDERPTFEYPIEVEFKNGKIVTVDSDEALHHLKVKCKRGGRPGNGDHPGKRDCFTIVYPVTLVFPDGTTADVADADEWKSAIMEWKENHPDSDERPTFEYPIKVEFKNGKIVTVDSDEALHHLKVKCKRGGRPGNGDHPGNGGFGACFKIVFPATLVFPDGSTAEVSAEREIGQLIREWKKDHPDSDAHPMFEFPLTVKFRDGTTQEVLNSEELEDLKLECR